LANQLIRRGNKYPNTTSARACIYSLKSTH
jgi:hypothetical protein